MRYLRSLLIIAVIVLGAISVDARTFALVTGVSTYDIEEANLPQASKDAKAVRDLLLTQTRDVTTLTSKFANRDNILEKLRAIANRAQKGDRIVFFFSGHGDEGFLLTSDMKPLFFTDLVNVFSSSQADEVICMIDACFAGSMATAAANANKDSNPLKPRNGHVYLLSCRADEKSREAPWVGQGYFTQALLKGLRGKSDYNHDREVSVIELFKYIHADVVRRSDKGQHPVLIAPKEMHDTVLARWEVKNDKK